MDDFNLHNIKYNYAQINRIQCQFDTKIVKININYNKRVHGYNII